MLENKQLTEEMLLSCLATCEDIIRKNAYLEKQWDAYWEFSDYTELDWNGLLTEKKYAKPCNKNTR